MGRSILVTNAGGSLGCGILRLLRAMRLPETRIVGLATVPVSAANHLCDAIVVCPPTYDEPNGPDIAFLERVCKDQDVGLIIPATDYETWQLRRAGGRLPNVACSNAEVSRAFYDKYLTWQTFDRLGLPFAKSSLPSAYRGSFERPFVKARFGGLSQNIVPNCPDPSAYSDEYVVQEELSGTEVTAAFYVTKAGAVHGQIAFERSLRFGSTVLCETTSVVDDQIRDIAETLARKGGVTGSCNLQGKVRDGLFVPFEVNGRVSGTASIRAQFGFEDVRYLVEEYLFDIPPSPCVTTRGCAVRMMTDVIYPDRTLSEVARSEQGHYFF